MEKLEQLRDLARQIAAEETSERWRINLEIITGITKGLSGRTRRGWKTGDNTMAKKLCAYYMRREDFSYQVIANTLGLKSHGTALYHCRTCEDFLDPKTGDRDMRFLHRQIQEKKVLDW